MINSTTISGARSPSSPQDLSPRRFTNVPPPSSQRLPTVFFAAIPSEDPFIIKLQAPGLQGRSVNILNMKEEYPSLPLQNSKRAE